MKKSIVIIAFLLALPVRGMERQQREKPYSIMVYNTQILVKNSPLYNVDPQIGIVGVGRKWQRKLQRPSFGDNLEIGSTEFFNNVQELGLLYFGKATHDSYITGQELWKEAQYYPINNLLLRIVEPDITKKKNHSTQTQDWYYWTKRDTNKVEMQLREYESTVCGDKALEEALIDLGLCYTILFAKGINNLERFKEREKSIALSPFSYMGFPEDKEAPVLVKAIIDYIKANASNKEKSYKRIHLHVLENEFNLYKKLFDEETISQEENFDESNDVSQLGLFDSCVIS